MVANGVTNRISKKLQPRVTPCGNKAGEGPATTHPEESALQPVDLRLQLNRRMSRLNIGAAIVRHCDKEL